MIEFEAINEQIFAGDGNLAARIDDNAQILQERIAERRNEEGTVRRDAEGKNLLEARRELLGIAGLIGEEILFVAGDCIDPGKEMTGVGAVGAGRAGIVGVAEEVKRELAFGTSRIAETKVRALVAVAIVGNSTVGVQAREVVGPTEASKEAAAAGGEMASVETAAFGKEREVRRAASGFADDVDHASDGVGTV